MRTRTRGWFKPGTAISSEQQIRAAGLILAPTTMVAALSSRSRGISDDALRLLPRSELRHLSESWADPGYGRGFLRHHLFRRGPRSELRGTVFRVTSEGAVTTLHNFCSKANCADGNAPIAGLIQATDGNFYGTTTWGGTNTSLMCGPGCGTIFRITPGGKLTTLYSFCAQTNCGDGVGPVALIRCPCFPATFSAIGLALLWSVV